MVCLHQERGEVPDFYGEAELEVGGGAAAAAPLPIPCSSAITNHRGKAVIGAPRTWKKGRPSA